MKLWQKEHPESLDDIDPEFLSTLVDRSWHNDALPFLPKILTKKNAYLLLSTTKNSKIER